MPLRNPVMIAAFEGWNDAGDAASAAVEQLGLIWDAVPLTELDPEGFYDFQVTRPTVRLVDGVTRTIEWPTTRLSVCRLPDSPSDVILVHGIEPNFRWRAFCDELLKIAVEHQVSKVIGLGALLADAAHPPHPGHRFGARRGDAAELGLTRSRYEGPTGIAGVFQDACVQAGIPALSFWASRGPVPQGHPRAAAPGGGGAWTSRSRWATCAQADEWESEVTQIASEDEEILEYIRALEEREHRTSRSSRPPASRSPPSSSGTCAGGAPKPGGDSWR